VQKHLPATLDAEGVKHNAKVLLLTMDPDAAQHPVFRFKFLVFKVEKGLISPGASWNAMDGDGRAPVALPLTTRGGGVVGLSSPFPSGLWPSAPIRRPISAESDRIMAESLAFQNLCVNYIVTYIGAFGEGLKMVLFSNFSQRVGSLSLLEFFFKKIRKLIFNLAYMSSI
jgi:hypothetical protein